MIYTNMKWALPYLILLPIIIVLFSPSFIDAAGLVPCGGWNEQPCQACHVVQMGQKILTWTISIMASVIALVFAIGGMQMVMSGGSTEGVSKAKSKMTNSIIGFIILLSAWLVIDTIMKLIVNTNSGATSRLGTWNQIQCVDQPRIQAIAWTPEIGLSRPVVGGGTQDTLTPAQLAARASAADPYEGQLCQIAAAQGIGSQCNMLQALMAIESNGNPNAVSPVGAAGLMQIMPGTARTLDPSLNGLSDAEVRTKLQDPAYNMALGVKYYDQLYDKYGGNVTEVLAAYNGGTAATQPSRDCPGLQRYQCVWDSPGCYGTTDTSCTPNTGYQETRNYVRNVSAVSCQISGDC